MATITSTIKLVDQMTPTLNKISKAIDRVNTQTSKMGSTKTWSGFNNGIHTATKSTHNLYNALRRVAFTLATLRGVQGAVTVSDTMMNANARINNLTNDAEKTAFYMDAIYAASQRSRGNFMDMANSVGKLGTIAGHAFGSVEEMIGFTELMNKLFVISGASAAESSNAMYQLTQAMAAGKLQGDEMRSILENAPMLAQKIAEALGVSIGEVKELGAEGKITANVIKEALFGAADDIEEKFENMPKTIGQTWTEIKNHALNAFRPVIDRVQQFINSPMFERFKNKVLNIITGIADKVILFFELLETPRVQTALQAISNGFVAIWQVASWVGSAVVNIITWMADNWSWLSNVIYFVITLMLLYKAVAIASHVAAAAMAIVHGVAEFAAALMAGQAWAWVILVIVSLIAIVYLAVAAWNHFTGQTVSATGIIFGSVAFIISCIYNLFVFLWDIFLSIIHIIVFLGKIIWQVCVDIIEFIVALVSNIVLFATMVMISAFFILFSIGNNIIDTIGWVVECFGVMVENLGIYMGQFKDRASIEWQLFKAGAAISLWGILVTASEAFTSLAGGARDVAVKMLKPFADFANGVKSFFNSIKLWWNALADKLSVGFTVPDWLKAAGSFLGVHIGDRVGITIPKFENVDTTPITAEGWVGDNGTVDILGASDNLASALGDYWSLVGEKNKLDSEFKEMPEYTVNWGNTWTDLGNMWSGIPWSDIGTFEGSNYLNAWNDLSSSLGDVWDSSQYSNPIDAFKDWYDKGVAFENGVADVVNGLGALLSGLMGGGTKDVPNTPADILDKYLGNSSGNVPQSLEDILDGYSGSPSDLLGAIADNTGKGAGSTANIEDTLDLAEDELELLRKIAEKEVVNRFTTAEIKVDMTNNNNVSSKMDLDGIVTHLSNKLYEELGVVASGVHY